MHVSALTAECRFADCAQETEPGCADVGASADGRLAPKRLESYLKLVREHNADPDAVLRASPSLLRGLLDLGFVERAAAF